MSARKGGSTATCGYVLEPHRFAEGHVYGLATGLTSGRSTVIHRPTTWCLPLSDSPFQLLGSCLFSLGIGFWRRCVASLRAGLRILIDGNRRYAVGFDEGAAGASDFDSSFFEIQFSSEITPGFREADGNGWLLVVLVPQDPAEALSPRSCSLLESNVLLF